MFALAELLIGLVVQVEDQLELQRRRAMRLVTGLLLALGATVLMLVGLVWLTWAGYAQLSVWLEPPAAGALIGLVCLVAGGAAYQNARRKR